MRCYLKRGGRILGVEMLVAGPDDELVRQSHAIFDKQPANMFDSFEVWDRTRFLFRFERAPVGKVELYIAQGHRFHDGKCVICSMPLDHFRANHEPACLRRPADYSTRADH
jgi:hypothetical protein